MDALTAAKGNRRTPTQEGGVTTRAYAASSRAYTALVIDDEPEICNFIAQVGEGLGLKIQTAETVEQFRQTYLKSAYDLIFVDLFLGRDNGIDLIRFLAAERCAADIYLMSGQDSRVLRAAERLGQERGLAIAGVLPKPIDLGDLEGVMGRYFASEETRIDETMLRNALDAGEITAFLQPKVALAPGLGRPVSSFEALARWRHPGRGLISPQDFIPLAEDSGLIGHLTDAVLGRVLADLGPLASSGDQVPVAVNLSPLQLNDVDLPEKVLAALDRAGVPPRLLHLELTESAAANQGSAALDILARLRLAGIELSIDDFGTGHSSLVQLHRLPFSELKIDRSLIMNLATDRDAMTITKAIVDLGHNLGMKICAEGVETEDIARRLADMNCDLGQGYLFGRPVPREELHAAAAASGTPQGGS